MTYIELTSGNLPKEHICCAISDGKCRAGYEMKKRWLAAQMEAGYGFTKLHERAKVFIEYGPAEKAWLPIVAPDCLALGCFWVSGRYKGQGHGKALLQRVIDQAKQQHKKGIVAVVGKKKFHFMSDTKWLLEQGFQEVDNTPAGFSLLSLPLVEANCRPHFREAAKRGTCPHVEGLVAYYSDRCPYTDHYVAQVLVETARLLHLPLTLIKLETLAQAQDCPTPATVFSLFYKGCWVTTDMSVCSVDRLQKALGIK